MKFRFSFDEGNKVVKIEFFHYLEDDDVLDFDIRMQEILKDKVVIGAILDHSPLLDKGLPKLSRKGRKEFANLARNSGVKKMAMVAVPAMVKTVSRTIGFLAKDKDVETRFFQSETEAITWLKEG